MSMPLSFAFLSRFIRRIFVHPLDAAILGVVWIGVNAGLYAHYGVKIVSDSPRYLNYAQKIADGLGWYEPHNIWYLGYVLLVLVVKSLFFTNEAVVAVQVLVHGVAAAVLYRTSYRLFASRRAALATAVLFLGWIEIPTWNFYILAESWYTSLICFVLYYLVSFDGSLKRWIITTLVVVLAFITKPTGIAALIAYGVFLLSYYSVRIRKLKPVAYLIGMLIVPLLYGLINQMLASFVLIENYATGEIVYGMSTVHEYAGREQLILPTGNLDIPSFQNAPVLRLLLFVISNPIYFIKLSLLKLLYFLGHIRPYYSWLHNAFIVTTLYPIYLLAGKALLQKRSEISIRRFFFVFLLMHMVAITATSVDWDGRFLMPLLPVVFLLAGQEIFSSKGNQSVSDE